MRLFIVHINFNIYNIYPHLSKFFDMPISNVENEQIPMNDLLDHDFYGYLNYSNEEVLSRYASIETYKKKEKKRFNEEIQKIKYLLKNGDLNLLKKQIKKCKVFGFGLCGTGDVHFLAYKK